MLCVAGGALCPFWTHFSTVKLGSLGILEGICNCGLCPEEVGVTGAGLDLSFPSVYTKHLAYSQAYTTMVTPTYDPVN